MPKALDTRALALEMQAAQDLVQQIAPFTARFPAFDLAAAYEVAHLIHRARLAEGAKPIGRKIGFTNPDMWSKFGVREPIWAYIYDTTVVQLHDTKTTCQLSRFAEPKIEPEVVFKFRTAPPPGAGIIGVLNAIDWVAHGFEIVQSHFPGWKFRAPDTVADWALHGTLLIGPPQPRK
jgi:2-oxo-3-hexenedioate decarboxylase